MGRNDLMNLVYVTSSEFKVRENEVFREHCRLSNGKAVKDLFSFDVREVNIKEVLEVDLHEMVRAEVKRAYARIQVPCIVEHAGLIFSEYKDRSYPGGLTKAMWNALGTDFIEETNSAERPAVARAVVAYCDGMSISTFEGETHGRIASQPRGQREFYWDTVFIPDCPDGTAGTLTYAEIADHEDYGLQYKVLQLSQSARAMKQFLDHIVRVGKSPLWEQS